MKELYENAEMDVVSIDAADVICTSDVPLFTRPSNEKCPTEDPTAGDAFL